MDHLRVARDLFDSGNVAASYRVMDQVQPDFVYMRQTYRREFSGDFLRCVGVAERRGFVTNAEGALREWVNTLGLWRIVDGPMTSTAIVMRFSP